MPANQNIGFYRRRVWIIHHAHSGGGINEFMLSWWFSMFRRCEYTAPIQIVPGYLHVELAKFSQDMFCDEEIPIPFLPLPPTFNYFNRTDWQMVSQNIQEWLTSEVDTRSAMWTWGRDAFWLAFVAAYPSFPNGQWPMWDPRIPLEGEFIEQWLERSGGDSAGEDLAFDEVASVSDIWDDFCKHVALFYPFSLLSSGQTDATD
jgi:hypothetical protein